jgi:mannitol-1-phosphate/altronate dehydrogenase
MYNIVDVGYCEYLVPITHVYIDIANKQGIFNGRVLVVKSTDSPGSDNFQQQDGLYTVVVRGFEQGQIVDKWNLNASLSRVLAANSHWQTILEAAENPAMQIVVSNTTEVGIVLAEESIHANPPASFPAKLLAFLYKRYQYFKGTADAGMVIVPTELISNKVIGKKIIHQLKNFENQLENQKEMREKYRIEDGFKNGFETRQILAITLNPDNNKVIPFGGQCAMNLGVHMEGLSNVKEEIS